MDTQIKKKIFDLKQKKNAIILAHYYVDGEIQDIADYVGDSLELARKASVTDADIIVFAGVHFMAETAKIISPNKKVLIPDIKSGCPLADSMSGAGLKKMKEQYPDHVIVNYVNSTAEIKAMSDLICTSSNAVDMVKSFDPGTKILFGPDKNLGAFVKSFVNNEMVIWDGNCPVHENFSAEKLKALKLKFPEAVVLAHPEANKPVLLLADLIGSTSKIIKYAVESDKKQFIIATEPGVIHTLKKQTSEKEFIPLPPVQNLDKSICFNMKKHTVEKVLQALENEQFEIFMDSELIKKAALPIKRMLDMSIKLGLIK
ncbi:MAG: quinolinate synthase NadA [Bacteroidales bacterium]|nr:quinolinate synthase NadA [Bacteroidales bacterium]